MTGEGARSVGSKIKRLCSVNSLREVLLLLLGWCATALLLAVGFACIWRLFGTEQEVTGHFLRGLLFFLPLSLSYLAAYGLRRLWQYLLCSLVLCGLCWVLLGTPFAMLPLALFSFLRGRNRLEEEPQESVLDTPALPLTFFFVLPFLCSAVMDSPVLQKLSLVAAALYFLCWAAYRGISRIHGYLLLNRDMAGLPAKRILRMSGMALAAVVLVAAGLLLPALLSHNGFLKIDPQAQQDGTAAVWVPQRQEDGMGNMADMQKLLGEEPAFQIPAWIGYVFSMALYLGLAAGGLYLLYRLILYFRGSFRDNGDLVQYLGAEEQAVEVRERQKGERLPRLDFSPNAVVRRRYRRAVLRAAKKKPERWASPSELEEAAGLSGQKALHDCYEKARYSEEGCTQEESRSLKRR